MHLHQLLLCSMWPQVCSGQSFLQVGLDASFRWWTANAHAAGAMQCVWMTLLKDRTVVLALVDWHMLFTVLVG
jgi:hypothetical protein